MKNKKPTIKVAPKKTVDDKAANKFIAGTNSRTFDEMVAAKDRERREKHKIKSTLEEETLPWMEPDVDLEKMVQIPPIRIPNEYLLKLRYLKKASGMTIQEILRRGLKHQINEMMDQYL